jgi:hypothetical protein
MTKEEALKVLENVCAKFMGNLEDHKVIQTALQVVKSEEKPDKTEVKEE